MRVYGPGIPLTVLNEILRGSTSLRDKGRVRGLQGFRPAGIGLRALGFRHRTPGLNVGCRRVVVGYEDEGFW